MADWQFRLDVADFWHNDEFPIHVKAEILAGRITDLLPKIYARPAEMYQDLAFELEMGILPRFEEMAEHKNDRTDDFDDALTELYDWADTALDEHWGGKKMCWVNSFR